MSSRARHGFVAPLPPAACFHPIAAQPPAAWDLAHALTRDRRWRWCWGMVRFEVDGNHRLHGPEGSSHRPGLPLLTTPTALGGMLELLAETGPGWLEALAHEVAHPDPAWPGWQAAVARALARRWGLTPDRGSAEGDMLAH